MGALEGGWVAWGVDDDGAARALAGAGGAQAGGGDGEVQKAAQVDPRFQMTRVGLEARFVHELRLLRCGFLECKRL